MREAIERCFGTEIEGFHAYRYFKGNSALRSWMAIPLTMGILERRQGVIDALFSPRLMIDDGLATEAGVNTFWDRSTLYGLRGVLAGGDTERGVEWLTRYSQRRLLGEHVPYPIELYPEGEQKQLAAESALYCRIFTEGLFGIRPTGFRSFQMTPRLPTSWPVMRLRNVGAFGSRFTITVTRVGSGRTLRTVIQGLQGQMISQQESEPGESIRIDLPFDFPVK